MGEFDNDREYDQAAVELPMRVHIQVPVRMLP